MTLAAHQPVIKQCEPLGQASAFLIILSVIKGSHKARFSLYTNFFLLSGRKWRSRAAIKSQSLETDEPGLRRTNGSCRNTSAGPTRSWSEKAAPTSAILSPKRPSQAFYVITKAGAEFSLTLVKQESAKMNERVAPHLCPDDSIPTLHFSENSKFELVSR